MRVVYEHRDDAGEGVGHDHIQKSVAVEVAHRDENRAAPGPALYDRKRLALGACATSHSKSSESRRALASSGQGALRRAANRVPIFSSVEHLMPDTGIICTKLVIGTTRRRGSEVSQPSA